MQEIFYNFHVIHIANKMSCFCLPLSPMHFLNTFTVKKFDTVVVNVKKLSVKIVYYRTQHKRRGVLENIMNSTARNNCNNTFQD